MPQPIPPTIGRIVNYVMENGPGHGKIRPAIIVNVISPEMVNLQVFTDGTNDGADNVEHVTSISYAPVGENGVPMRTRSWHWMPFQLGQAAATKAAPAAPPLKSKTVARKAAAAAKSSRSR